MLQGSDHLCIKTRLTMTESSKTEIMTPSARVDPSITKHRDFTEENYNDDPTSAVWIITEAASTSDQYASESNGQSGLSYGKERCRKAIYQVHLVELSPDGDLNPVDEMPVAGRSQARSLSRSRRRKAGRQTQIHPVSNHIARFHFTDTASRS